MSKYEARQDFCWSVALDTWEGGDVVKEAELYTLSKLGPEVAENSGANLELHLSGAHGTVTIEPSHNPCLVRLSQCTKAAHSVQRPNHTPLRCKACRVQYDIVPLANEAGVDGVWITSIGTNVCAVHFAQVKIGYRKRSDTGELIKHKLVARRVNTTRKHVWVVHGGV